MIAYYSVHRCLLLYSNFNNIAKEKKNKTAHIYEHAMGMYIESWRLADLNVIALIVFHAYNSAFISIFDILELWLIQH